MIKTMTASQFSEILWFENLRLSDSEQFRYHIYGVYHYSGHPDINRLQDALQSVVNTNYNLRSNFIEVDGELKQIIHDRIIVTLDQYTADTPQANQAILQKEIKRPFDLTNGPLFRFVLIHNIYNQTTSLLLNFHHIIIDNAQYTTLIKSIEDNYQHAHDVNVTDEPDIAELQSYIAWEKEQIEKAEAQYWFEKLKNYPLRIDLPYKTQLLSKTTLTWVSKSFSLDKELYDFLT